MLLLAQRGNDKLVLETADGPIELHLVRADGQDARIFVDAPPSVRILRRPGSATPVVPVAAEAPVETPEDDCWWLDPAEVAARGGNGQGGGIAFSLEDDP